MSKKSCQTPREALQKLKIDSGGKGSTERICGDLLVSLHEAPRDSDVPYQISVLWGSRTHSVGLSMKDVVTKGKSAWRRDNRWRLQPEAIDRFEPQIANLVAKLPDKP
jgi:hypothetical protein